MKVTVGCPVAGREWVLPTWKAHVDEALKKHEVEFVFVVGTAYKESRKIVEEWGDVELHAEVAREDKRNWRPDRIKRMVKLRNQLLAKVREKEPDYFLSLDSDILIAPDAFEKGLELFEDESVWAVGLKCWMTPEGLLYPSNAMRQKADPKYARLKVSKPTEVDIIMAAKIMDPRAYNIDYKFEQFGEDGGWSEEVIAAGGKLMWDGRIPNKHVMERYLLEEADERVGW